MTDTKCVSSQGVALVEQGIAVGMSAPNNKLRRQSRIARNTVVGVVVSESVVQPRSL